jgi:hypothetical protein
VFLRVEVYLTDFESPSEYISEISCRGVTISPYCKPDKDDGNAYFECLVNENVADLCDVTRFNGNLEVLVRASSRVDSFPYNGYVLYVRLTVSNYQVNTVMPTSEPSAMPSGEPSSSPSSFPTSPTSNPTTDTPTSEPTSSAPTRPEGFDDITCEKGSNEPRDGVECIFTGMGGKQYVIVVVEVWPTDFGADYEYISSIAMNSHTVSTYCNPSEDNGKAYYTCLGGYNAAPDVGRDGQLKVTIRAASNEVDANPHLGYVLYARVTVRGADPPSSAPSLAPQPTARTMSPSTTLPTTAGLPLPSQIPTQVPSTQVPSADLGAYVPAPVFADSPYPSPSPLPSSSPSFRAIRTVMPTDAADSDSSVGSKSSHKITEEYDLRLVIVASVCLNVILVALLGINVYCRHRNYDVSSISVHTYIKSMIYIWYFALIIRF